MAKKDVEISYAQLRLHFTRRVNKELDKLESKKFFKTTNKVKTKIKRLKKLKQELEEFKIKDKDLHVNLNLFKKEFQKIDPMTGFIICLTLFILLGVSIMFLVRTLS
ncbi:hypothetical protein [Mycoplasma sp. Ms02]|uniref:hypothetical protein n=1 Tax=Mycoplasma sp. Ms02 TaxID=353851 RepID=UPI001C89467B|nr:hypothetical protein [Mycoplasma sp. Ms02]QZE12357.1 hypothetical protein K4L35_03430 [Mycoplasma sp. Ms02]